MRDVVISASSLWARAIDLTVLVPSQGEWVQEVIRRTGQAPLHIFAPLRYGMPCHGARRTAAVTILETLFKHHWKRIRTVNLHAIRLDLSQEPVFEELLQQPAPRLEVFSVCLANPNTSLRLFSNDSPSLKECELSHIAFGTDTLWLRNVRQLHSCSYHWVGQRTERIMAPSKLLNVLSHMPLLETLCGLDRCTLGPLDIIRPLPNIVLPRLSSIALKTGGNSDAIIAVLTHINPAPGCNFYMDFCRTEGFRFTAGDITAFYRLVFQYFRNHLKSQRLSNFSIYFNKRGRGIFKIEAGPINSRFFFSLDLASPPLFARLFFSNENLRQFFSLLENEEVLNITNHMLPILLTLRNDDNSLILPRLRRLFLPVDFRDRVVEFHDIFLFLEWRWEIGLPLDSIHLPMPDERVDIHYDLSDLDRFTGLEVEWENGAGRYLCGSGEPDQLIFPMSIHL